MKYITSLFFMATIFVMPVVYQLLCPGGVCPTPTSKVTPTVIKTTEVVITETEKATATDQELPSDTPVPTVIITMVTPTLPPQITYTSTLPATQPPSEKTKHSPPLPPSEQQKKLPSFGCQGENCRPQQQDGLEDINWDDPDIPNTLMIVFMIGLAAFVVAWAVEWDRKN